MTRPIFAWVVEHAADLITRLSEGSDGQTAWQRLRGRPYRGEMPDIGSRVMHRVPGKVQGGLLQDRWLPGIWLGKRWSSDEHIIGMDDGKVIRARAILEGPEERRWSNEAVNALVGVPWAPSGTLSFKGEKAHIPPVMRAPDEPREEAPPVLPRGMRMQTRHFEQVWVFIGMYQTSRTPAWHFERTRTTSCPLPENNNGTHSQWSRGGEAFQSC